MTIPTHMTQIAAALREMSRRVIRSWPNDGTNNVNRIPYSSRKIGCELVTIETSARGATRLAKPTARLAKRFNASPENVMGTSRYPSRDHNSVSNARRYDRIPPMRAAENKPAPTNSQKAELQKDALSAMNLKVTTLPALMQQAAHIRAKVVKLRVFPRL